EYADSRFHFVRCCFPGGLSRGYGGLRSWVPSYGPPPPWLRTRPSRSAPAEAAKKINEEVTLLTETKSVALRSGVCFLNSEQDLENSAVSSTRRPSPNSKRPTSMMNSSGLPILTDSQP